MSDSIGSEDNCKHKNDSKFSHMDTEEKQGRGYYYGTCIYCIMEGQEWDEQWDSWDEISGRIEELIRMGYDDYKNGITNFLDSCKKPKVKYCYVGEIYAFRNMYSFGQQLAASRVDFPVKKFGQND